MGASTDSDAIGWSRRVGLLRRPREPHVVTNNCAWSNGQLFRIGDVEHAELGFALPHFPQEIREHVDRHLLAGATAISKATRGIASVVAHRLRLAVDHAINRAKATIPQRGTPAVGDLE